MMCIIYPPGSIFFGCVWCLEQSLAGADRAASGLHVPSCLSQKVALHPPPASSRLYTPAQIQSPRPAPAPAVVRFALSPRWLYICIPEKKKTLQINDGRQNSRGSAWYWSLAVLVLAVAVAAVFFSARRGSSAREEAWILW